jgi:NADH:ubiquinone oxidoreductase subunit E
VLCRSLTCQLLGANEVLDRLKENLKTEEHGTTTDGQFSLLTEECLAACDHAPCLLINEKLHKRVTPEAVPKLLKDPKNAEVSMPRSDLFDKPMVKPADLPKTSDVKEMKDA